MLQRRDLFRATVAGLLSKVVGNVAASRTVDAVEALFPPMVYRSPRVERVIQTFAHPLWRRLPMPITAIRDTDDDEAHSQDRAVRRGAIFG